MPSAVRTAIATLAATLMLAAPAGAAVTRPPTGFPSLPESVASPHFVVHYTTTGSDATNAGAATALANYAESAYFWIVTTWGYPPPKDDGDGKTDIYVTQLPGIGAGAAADSNGPATSTAFIVTNTNNIGVVYPVAHEFFHTIQMGMYQHEEGWLDESTAEWAGQNVVVALGGEAPPNWYPSPWVPLNCMGATCTDQDAAGYRGSIFMEYLDEKYGMDLIRDVYVRAAAAGAGNYLAHSLQVLSDAIAARGGTLSGDLVGYALAASSGAINRPGVTTKRPRSWASYVTGDNVGRLSPVTLSVDHLALKSLFLMGASPYDSRVSCSARSLGVEVALPAGVPTQPALVRGTTVTPLAISGDVARGELPWSTCYNSNAVLVLPNGSTSADGQPFAVTLTLTNTEPPYIGQDETPPKTTRLTAKAKAGKRGKVTLKVTTATTGTLTMKATTKLTSRSKARTYATAKKKVARAGTTTVTLTPTKTAAKLLRSKKKLKLTIAVTFAPKTGARRTVRVTCTVRSS